MDKPTPPDFATLFAAHAAAWTATGRTRAELARALGAAHQSIVNQYERGLNRPDVSRLARMCAVFGLSVEDARKLYTAVGIDLTPVLPEN